MECKVKEKQTLPFYFFVLSLVYLHCVVCVGVHLIELRTCEEGLFQGGSWSHCRQMNDWCRTKRTRNTRSIQYHPQQFLFLSEAAVIFNILSSFKLFIIIMYACLNIMMSPSYCNLSIRNHELWTDGPNVLFCHSTVSSSYLPLLLIV